jgi:hypothetical protein
LCPPELQRSEEDVPPEDDKTTQNLILRDAKLAHQIASACGQSLISVSSKGQKTSRLSPAASASSNADPTRKLPGLLTDREPESICIASLRRPTRARISWQHVKQYAWRIMHNHGVTHDGWHRQEFLTNATASTGDAPSTVNYYNTGLPE